jgi:Family of unknown function (DUF5946)
MPEEAHGYCGKANSILTQRAPLRMNTPHTKFIQCPGCGLMLPDQNLPRATRHNASGECQRLNEELAAYHLQLGDATFLHQHAVDSYGAQHAGAPSRNITTAYALVGLYLAIEHGYTGLQVQKKPNGIRTANEAQVTFNASYLFP